ncbi:MAG: hypothetical protein ACR2OJ_03760 [Hyphomicrobiales bacterium]
MFEKPSLIARIAIGKLVGLVFGLIGFFMLPVLSPDTSEMLRWAILLWYTTLGAFIGLFGVMDEHPLFGIRLYWWFRGPWIGAWMNFVLTLFAYDTMRTVLVSVFGQDGALTSPFWFVAEGAIVGLIIAYFATRFGGEGPLTASEDAARIAKS